MGIWKKAVLANLLWLAACLPGNSVQVFGDELVFAWGQVAVLSSRPPVYLLGAQVVERLVLEPRVEERFLIRGAFWSLEGLLEEWSRQAGVGGWKKACSEIFNLPPFGPYLRLRFTNGAEDLALEARPEGEAGTYRVLLSRPRPRGLYLGCPLD